MSLFTASFNEKAEKLYQTADSKGWRDEECNPAERIALMHSELSEALEALRHRNPPSNHIPDFSGVEEEMADAVIRIMVFCYARGFNLAGAIEAKDDFNKTRPYKHGGKEF